MSSNAIKISKINSKTTSKSEKDHYTVCLLQSDVDAITIDETTYNNVSNSIFFLLPRNHWKITKNNASTTSGYVLYLPKQILDNPLLSKLHINEVRLFATDEIAKINLAPGIEKRALNILEMIDELLGSQLNHKEDAIMSLLNTFFVYCDGQCNIKSNISENNSKKNIVFKYKKLVNEWFYKYHDVEDYAKLIHVYALCHLHYIVKNFYNEQKTIYKNIRNWFRLSTRSWNNSWSNLEQR